MLWRRTKNKVRRLSSRRARAGTIARALGSFMRLLGRTVIVQGVKRG